MGRDYLTFGEYNKLAGLSRGEDVDLVTHASGIVTCGRRGAGLLIVDTIAHDALLLYRSPAVLEPDQWGIPGGAAKENIEMHRGRKRLESSLVTAVTEGKEEMRRLPHGYLYTVAKHHRVPGTSFVYSTHVLTISPEERERFVPELNWENTAYRWDSLAKLRKDTPPLELHDGVHHIVRSRDIARILSLDAQLRRE